MRNHCAKWYNVWKLANFVFLNFGLIEFSDSIFTGSFPIQVDRQQKYALAVSLEGLLYYSNNRELSLDARSEKTQAHALLLLFTVDFVNLTIIRVTC